MKILKDAVSAYPMSFSHEGHVSNSEHCDVPFSFNILFFYSIKHKVNKEHKSAVNPLVLFCFALDGQRKKSIRSVCSAPHIS